MERSVDHLEVLEHALRRRTIAVISHPDAGKSTLTEALLLHAHAISEAGAVHGKSHRRATVSDWMAMEQSRGISISSAAIQFEHDGVVINLVDTPGHADFSEDTYRVLSAVDAAIMLVDASKGLEIQTMKLFEVCRKRAVPIITMINKWDRPGHDPLSLIDEIQSRTGMLPTPLNWPIGAAGDFHGLLSLPARTAVRFHRTPGGATIAQEEELTPSVAISEFEREWATAQEEAALLELDGHTHEEVRFLDGRSTPVLFGAAVHNIGVHALLDAIVAAAPPAEARRDRAGRRRPVNSEFSGFVFKVQSGMDAAHRDKLAFVRVCSGRFERGGVVTHAQTGRPFATKYAQQLFGRDRESVDIAYPGDIVGLVNAASLKPGDTLYVGENVQYPPLPRFPSEHFRTARAVDASKHKQFRRGIEQLDLEGVIQVLRSDRRGEHVPVLGAVGPMQFDVVEERMRDEFHSPVTFETLPYTVARATTRASAGELERMADVEVLTRSDSTLIALTTTIWRLRNLQRNNPDLVLRPLDDEEELKASATASPNGTP